MPLPKTVEGMGIKQLIAMLLALEAQGATHVQLACRTSDAEAVVSDAEWVSMAPVDGCGYIAALLPQSEWQHASNAALESLDW